MKLPLTIIVWGLLVVVILTKANNVYAEWIIPSQLNEAYKIAQHYSNSISNSNSTTSIPAGQDHNSTRTTTTAMTIAIEKTPSSSVPKNK